ncbi:MAG: BCD family MFS transporter [Roseiflexaceae bacterium]|nr:BCD family MFS transporter [Roseiflexaceae bacterium]
MSVLLGIIKTLRLALPKIGVGWMFALLTSNFNQIAIKDLAVPAIIITVMIGMHHFLSPFQIIWGRIADQHPIFGYRRTPYMLLGGLGASLVFVALPTVAVMIGNQLPFATMLGFLLLAIFGICIAAMGDTHHSLIAEVTTAKSRSSTIAVVWTFTIASAIASGVVMKSVMGDTYDFAKMQALYNLTPMIVMGSALLGVLGIERRLQGAQLQATVAASKAAAPSADPIRAALGLLRGNVQVRAFFMFVFLAILGIFLQDAILEVFGRDVFNMTLRETTSFQQFWGGGVLLGMLGIGAITMIFPMSKKLLASLGGAGTAFGLGLLTLTALSEQRALLNPSLVMMGVATGLFNVGALSMMMEMTVEGSTGLYMGLWGMAQAFGTGMASIVSGGLRTGLIESGLLSNQIGYTAIFGLETVIMVVSVAILRSVSIEEFKGVSREDMTRAMETGVTA